MRNSRKRTLRLTIAAVCVWQGTRGAFADVSVTWTDTTNFTIGNWNAASNWSPAVVPNNGASTYAVTLPGVADPDYYNVTLNVNATVDSLAVDTGANFLMYDSLTVTGNISLNSSFSSIIVGESSSEMTVDGTLINDGILSAEPGVANIHALDNNGLVEAYDGTINITGGGSGITDIPASAGVSVGGTGSINVINGGVSSNALASLATIEGVLTVSDAGQLTVNNSVTLSSTALINVGNVEEEGNAVLTITGGVTNSGLFTDSEQFPAAFDGVITVDGAFTNEATGTVSVGGTGGAVSFGSLDNLGAVTIATGATLSVSGSETVDGAGSISESGGANNINGAEGLTIAAGNGSNASYTLGGGTLTCYGPEYIGSGSDANGSFNQSGGNNYVSYFNEMFVGYASTSTGAYTLGNGSLVSTGAEIIGVFGTANFTQTGGTNLITGLAELDIAQSAGSNASYQLSGGTCSAQNVYVGGSSNGAGGNGSLTVSGSGSMGVNNALTVYNNGLLAVNGGSVNAATLNLLGQYTQTAGSATFGHIAGTGQVSISGGVTTLGLDGGGSQIGSLTMSASGTLDITNNHLIIAYGASDPIATIISYLRSGFNNGGWNGPGIISSSAQTPTNGFAYGVGFADGNDNVVSGLSSGQIELKYTLLGDANLDGTVNGSDFSILAANFGLGATNWDQGNFLYGSSVNGSDFSALAANFGQGDSGADVAVTQADINALDSFAIANGLPLPTIASVPEPASAGLLLAGITIMTRRRRN